MQAHLTTWEDRFWAKVEEAPNGCWLWKGALDPAGYGRFGSAVAGCRKGLTLRAPRIAYELVVGCIPKGMVIDHLCRTPACVNPAHLEAVTIRENTLRGQSFAAVNAAKTICKRGHPLSGGNMFRSVAGFRECRACRRLRDRKARS